MADMRLVILGAGGRMGRTLVKTVADTAGAVVVGAVEQPGSPLIGQDAGVLAGLPASGIKLTADLKPLLAGADGILDFTVPAATVKACALAAEAGIVHVVGTTGLSADDMGKLKAAAARATIMQSGNMSLGVNLLAALVRRVARALDEDFDIEIVEMHHNRKIDAPSGTALMLGQAAAQGRNIDLDKRSARGRDGITGARKRGDIGFAALRGGTVVGEHSVIFAGPAERVELTHRAEDRMLFARGAIKGALWARGKPPGLYSMADVLGLADF
jgi:4-hydroxy-tetrahydrodipicolinate reductase